MDFVRLDLNKEEYMQKIYTLIVLMAVVLLGGTSCNDEWKDEQYEHYIAFRSPLNNKGGVTEIFVPYSRKGADGSSQEGKSNYQLPLIVSGSTNNQQNIKVNVAHDPDTLQTLNLARYQHRTDLFYVDMGEENLGFVSFPGTVDFKPGEDVSLLDISFDFRGGIDMSQKWVLPLTVVDNASSDYKSHPRKNYAKAILRILPFNSFSGRYSGTTLQNFVKGGTKEVVLS